MSKKRYSNYKKGPKRSAEENHEVYERQAENARKLRAVTSKNINEKKALNSSYGGLLGFAYKPTKEEESFSFAQNGGDKKNNYIFNNDNIKN